MVSVFALSMFIPHFCPFLYFYLPYPLVPFYILQVLFVTNILQPVK